MNTKIFLGAMIAVASIQLNETLRAEASFPPVTITSITTSNGQLVLNWIGGRPTYQVQTLSDLAANWTNVGASTSNNFAMIPITGSQALLRVVSDFTARYRVTFNATWSQATHPTNWPANAHWSGLVGGTHNDSVHFFRLGETASEGIRRMAESGVQSVLLSEISVLTNSAAHVLLAGGGIGTSPGAVQLVFPQPMRRDFPLVTLTSMIAPSPDWFVGVDSLSLIEDGQWLTNKVVTLYGNDAGTDSGATYTSPDLVTSPRGVVTQFTGFPAIQEGIIVPFGTFAFTRLD